MFQSAIDEVNELSESELVELIGAWKDKAEDTFIQAKVGYALLRS